MTNIFLNILGAVDLSGFRSRVPDLPPILKPMTLPINVLAKVTSGPRGGNEIVVDDPAEIAAGQIIQIQWINRGGPDGSIIKSIYGKDSELAGSHHWTFEKRPLVRQTVRVTRVEGQKIILADVLLHNTDAALPRSGCAVGTAWSRWASRTYTSTSLIHRRLAII